MQCHTDGGPLHWEWSSHDAMADALADIAGDREIRVVLHTGTGDTYNHSRPVGTPALEVARSGLEAARQRSKDVVILDTAGRLHVDDAMMDELVRIAGAVTPTETLLVVDAMSGQEAVHVAEAFHARLPVTGLVLTKMDGDARGGAALSIRSVTGIPITYLGTGERPDGLEAFHPDRLAQRILGMGDVLSLVERVQETVDRDEAERVAQRMMDARFSLEDFKAQLQQIKKMGPIGQLVGLIPGAGQMAGAAQTAVDNGELRRIEAIIDSMTAEERRHPELIKASRRRRIASGSGTSTADVNRLLKQFSEMQRLMRSLGSSRLPMGGAFRGLHRRPLGADAPAGHRRDNPADTDRRAGRGRVPADLQRRDGPRRDGRPGSFARVRIGLPGAIQWAADASRRHAHQASGLHGP